MFGFDHGHILYGFFRNLRTFQMCIINAVTTPQIRCSVQTALRPARSPMDYGLNIGPGPSHLAPNCRRKLQIHFGIELATAFHAGLTPGATLARRMSRTGATDLLPIRQSVSRDITVAWQQVKVRRADLLAWRAVPRCPPGSKVEAKPLRLCFYLLQTAAARCPSLSQLVAAEASGVTACKGWPRRLLARQAGESRKETKKLALARPPGREH